MRKRKFLWAFIFGTVLVAFTVYILMDTFVIPRAYTTAASVAAVNINPAQNEETKTAKESSVVSDVTTATTEDAETESESSAEETSETISEPVVTATSYSDSTKTIELTTYYEYDTAIYVADIYSSSVTDLMSAFANDTYGRNITAKTSEIASDNNAVIAVNGDFYGSQESGYVIRNGVLYRDTADQGQEDLVIYADGSWEIINESDVTAQQLIDKGAWQVLSFGPAIVDNGEIAVSENEEVDRAKSSNPRTAIGFIDENHYVLLVSDGRTDESEGLSLYELAAFMQELGVKTAYNLDGGGSSTMYFNGEVVNNPTSSGRSIKERDVSDIIFF